MSRLFLDRSVLNRLPPAIARPAYDPAAVSTGIVHLGLGGFARSHLLRYAHDLMQRRPDALGWGVAGAGLLASDGALQAALARQDRLYTLVERSGEDETATVIGAVSGLAFAAETSEPLLDLISRPSTRIVSLTVTEHGYGLDRATKHLDAASPAIAADLADPERPHTAIGVIAEACRGRMAAGARSFTALSCDNIQHNGDVLRRAVLAFAGLRDRKLADWIEAEVRFPNTMVDRITPVTQPAEVAAFAERYGVADACPVFAEPFLQWVIEDDFADGRPAWEDVGAQFVGDVAPYEFMKLRLLNASHLAVAGLGRLIGHVFIDEAMRDGRLARYMRALMDRETGPTLRPVPGVDLDAYKSELVKRFSNPKIKDTLERVNTDAALNYLLDPIRDRLAVGADISLLALALAAWMRRVRGVDEDGGVIEVKHPLAGELRLAAEAGGPDPRPLLALRPLFGDLGQDPRLAEATAGWLEGLYREGASATLSRAEKELGFGG